MVIKSPLSRIGEEKPFAESPFTSRSKNDAADHRANALPFWVRLPIKSPYP